MNGLTVDISQREDRVVLGTLVYSRLNIMTLELIAERFVEGLLYVDSHPTATGTNQRTGNAYHPGLPPMVEKAVAEEVLNWWTRTYPSDFDPPTSPRTEYPYPNRRTSKCDIVFSSNGTQFPDLEFAIEVKRIQLVGDNGKVNDHSIQKVLSPYLKDRSLLHDIERFRQTPIAAHNVVLGYGFEFDFATCREALTRHPGERARVGNIRDVCHRNDSVNGEYYLDPLVTIVNRHLTAEGLVSEHCVKSFDGAWTHPCGGKGKVFAWMVAV
jgi:hypothetical protein